MTTSTTTPKVPANARGQALFDYLPTLTNRDLQDLTDAQLAKLADNGAIGGYWNNGSPAWTWTINEPDIDRYTTN